MSCRAFPTDDVCEVVQSSDAGLAVCSIVVKGISENQVF